MNNIELELANAQLHFSSVLDELLVKMNENHSHHARPSYLADRDRQNIEKAKIDFKQFIAAQLDSMESDVDLNLLLARIYFHAARTYCGLSSWHSDVEVDLTEKSVSYIDLYKQAHFECGEVIMGKYRGEELTEADVYAYLGDKYHLRKNNQAAINAIEKALTIYAEKYGKDSAEYALKLKDCLMSIDNNSKFAFIEKWAGKHSTVSEYRYVWLTACDAISLHEHQPHDENVANLKKKIEYLELANYLAQGEYDSELTKWRKIWIEINA